MAYFYIAIFTVSKLYTLYTGLRNIDIMSYCDRAYSQFFLLEIKHAIQLRH